MQDAFLWLVRPEAYAGREAFDEYMRQWTQTYVSASADARLPGMRGDAIEREARMHGMTLPTAIAHELAALGERLGVPLPT
jgi:LDH2 family malate/lactate/ureidoglycolate dehydrogenase